MSRKIFGWPKKSFYPRRPLYPTVLIANQGTEALVLILSCPQTNRRKTDSAVRLVALKDSRVTDAFGTPRLENNRAVSIPAL